MHRECESRAFRIVWRPRCLRSHLPIPTADKARPRREPASPAVGRRAVRERRHRRQVCASAAARRLGLELGGHRRQDRPATYREPIDRAMRLALSAQLRQLEHRLPFLATLGAAAPFIGLFGTVWGIMRSFNAIAAANNTSLAVVAPGIADALFATAMGLAAAIPAVVAYNKFTVEIGRFAGTMQGLIGRSSRLLSRAAVEGD